MPKPISFGKIDINLVSSMEETHGVPDIETPFHIVILGDFSGRTNSGVFEPGKLADRRIHPIDRDNFHEIQTKLNAEMHLPILGKDSPLVSLRFSKLDDFHPDNLFENLEVFQSLKDTRKTLKDPSTFNALIKELQSKEKPPEPSAPSGEMEISLQKISTETTGN